MYILDILFISSLICIMLIILIEVIKYSINLCLEKIKEKSLYLKHNYKTLRFSTRFQYYINLYYPKASLLRTIILYIIIATVYLFFYFKNYIVDFIKSININVVREWLIHFNSLIAKYNYIFSIAIAIMIFLALIILYSNHKNKFTKTINDFQSDKLHTILEYHSKIIYPISEIIVKNNKNIEHILLSLETNKGINSNYVAKKITEYNFPEIELNIYSGEPIVKKRKYYDCFNNTDFVSEDMSEEIKKLSELIIQFNKTKAFYSLNIFSQLNKKLLLPHPISRYIENCNIDEIIESLSSNLITNKYFEKLKDNQKYFYKDLYENNTEILIDSYNSIKFSIELIIIRSMEFTIKLEEYDKGLSKLLNIKRINVKNALSNALEKSK